MKKRIKYSYAILVIISSYLLFSVFVYLAYGYRLIECEERLEGLVSNIRVFRYDADGKSLSWEDIINEKDFSQGTKACPRTGQMYCYRGDDVTDKMPDQLIMVYSHKHPAGSFEKLSIFVRIDHPGDKIGIVYNDWDIEFVYEDEFQNAINRDNRLRRRLGLKEKYVGEL